MNISSGEEAPLVHKRFQSSESQSPSPPQIPRRYPHIMGRLYNDRERPTAVGVEDEDSAESWNSSEPLGTTTIFNRNPLLLLIGKLTFLPSKKFFTEWPIRVSKFWQVPGLPN